MKWENKTKEFDSIASVFMDKSISYCLWGMANLGGIFLKKYSHELNIIKVVDMDIQKQGVKIGHLIIESPNEIVGLQNYKIIVTTNAYRQVSDILKERGFKENIDYFDYFYFEQIYLLYTRNYLLSRRIDISLTEKCNLKCRKCNMFMPYFKMPADQPLAEVKKDIDNYFSVVDFVEVLNLLGGEPFLYPYLYQIVEYIGICYRNRINKMIIFTNGMLIPDEDFFDLLKRYKVILQFSDYTKVISYKNKFDEFKRIANKHEIHYYVFKNEKWGDFGFPENPHKIESKENLLHFFDSCKSPFRGLYKGKVYFCHLETSAVRAGIFPDSENDSFYLLKESNSRKKEYFEFDRGYSELGYVTFCSVCRGCDCVNDLFVPAAEQVEKVGR